MNSITEILMRIPALVAVSLEAQRRCPELFPIKDVTYRLQMSYYWLKSANQQMKSLIDSVEITSEVEEGAEHRLVIPTLLGTPEQLEYMKKNLTELGTGTYEYFNETSLPEQVKHKVEQSYNNFMEALFNTELSTTYYEQLRKQR